MLFNSLEFAIFLPIVFFLYWFATNKNLRNQNLLIVAASFLFYGWWDWRFLLLMVVTITLSYLSGLAIRQVRNNREEHSARRGARHVTALNITLNLAILGTFKYYNFFVDSFVDAFSLFGREREYAIQDLGLRWKRPLRHALYYALILSLFWFGVGNQQFIYFQF